MIARAKKSVRRRTVLHLLALALDCKNGDPEIMRIPEERKPWPT